ncbi:hypothetical protein PCANC_11573 [Puccinia coronata f. sp. avenae]|uniref:Uncharacterized protein n=1 Tax=Puccinia coronata f. sp. avenae TaxID=200324 RepID=A0A2N5V7V4_9BASI|nr:hypothetical protein PCANC_11573 [Puccinia coronata f. sp. avenae]
MSISDDQRSDCDGKVQPLGPSSAYLGEQLSPEATRFQFGKSISHCQPSKGGTIGLVIRTAESYHILYFSANWLDGTDKLPRTDKCSTSGSIAMLNTRVPQLSRALALGHNCPVNCLEKLLHIEDPLKALWIEESVGFRGATANRLEVTIEALHGQLDASLSGVRSDFFSDEERSAIIAKYQMKVTNHRIDQNNVVKEIMETLDIANHLHSENARVNEMNWTPVGKSRAGDVQRAGRGASSYSCDGCARYSYSDFNFILPARPCSEEDIESLIRALIAHCLARPHIGKQPGIDGEEGGRGKCLQAPLDAFKLHGRTRTARVC